MRPKNRLSVGVLCCLAAVPGAPAQELKERGVFKGHPYGVNRAALSPDGKILAAGGGDTRGGELKLYDAVAGREIAPLVGYKDSLYSLAFSADGKRLASAGGGLAQVWDVGARQEIVSFKGYSAYCVAFNRDGTRLAAAGGRDVKIWEVATGKAIAAFRHRVGIHGWVGVAFSPDLAILAARNYQEIDLWDVAAGKEKRILSEHRGEVGCMVWAADGKSLIASSTWYQGKGFHWRGDLKTWDVAAGKQRAAFPGPFGRVLAIAPSPDGTTLALLDSSDWHAEADVKLVEVTTGRQRVVRPPPGHSFRLLAFTPEGKLLAAGASVDTLRLWEVTLPKAAAKP